MVEPRTLILLQNSDRNRLVKTKLRGLYAITDDTLLSGRLLPAVQAALEGGCRVVQYRTKQADDAQHIREASDLRMLCHDYGAVLLINDNVLLARAVHADGVHLGQDDMSLQEARHWLGEEAIIGVTCHSTFALAETARAGGADYVAFGRFFGSSTKPSAPLAPLSVLAETRMRLTCPVVAIGGITLDNAGSLVEAGADMLAVVAGLFAPCPAGLEGIRSRAAAFQSLYDNTWQS